MSSSTSASSRYRPLSWISANTISGKMITMTQAPSVNFTIAKITTTIER